MINQTNKTRWSVILFNFAWVYFTILSILIWFFTKEGYENLKPTFHFVTFIATSMAILAYELGFRKQN